MITASAPAKAIILGEHTALYKNPALAMALDLRSYVTVGKRHDKEVRISAPELAEFSKKRQELGEALVKKGVELAGGGGYDLLVKSDIPLASGLGSSASIASALIAALSWEAHLKLPLREVAKAAWRCEDLVHGKSSGLDPFVVTYGGICLFEDGDVEKVASYSKPKFIIAHSGVTSDTAEIVSDMSRVKSQEPEWFNTFLGTSKTLVLEGREAIERGDARKLGELMDQNHELLKDMGLSCPQAERLVGAARDAGAYGAKICGAGRGGIILALVDGKTKDSVSKALSNAGGKIIRAEMSEEGVRIEDNKKKK